MGAYGTLDKGVAGQMNGYNSRIETRRVAETDGINFGLPVFSYVGDTDIYGYHNNRAKVVFDADFVTSNSVVITVDGTAVTAVPFNADHDTTMDDLVSQIEADIVGAVAALDATDANNRTIFITIEDDGDRVVSEAVTGGASQATGTITYDSTMVFVGISAITHRGDAEKQDLTGSTISASTAKYALSDPASILVDGWIYVVTGEAVDSENAAYVIVSGAFQGQMGDTVTSNIALTGAKFVETVSAAGLALVRINK